MAAVWQREWIRGSRQPVSGSTTSTSGTAATLSTGTNTSSFDPEELRQERDMELKQEVATTRLHMRGLVEEFCAGANGDVTAPNRWLSELHVAWLLRLAELDAAAQRIFISRQLQRLVKSWTPALQVISTSICKCLCFSSGLNSEEEASVGPPAASELAQFVKATLVKMFTFVHAIAALAPLKADDPSGQQHVFSSSVVGAAGKLRALLDVREALSVASEQIVMSFNSSPCSQSTTVTCDVGGFLSAELGKLDRAIRDAFDPIRTALIPSLHNNSSWGSTQILQSSTDIHKVTVSVINCINILSPKALFPVNFEPHHGDMCSVLLPQKDMCSMTTTLIMEMVGSLEEELARVSNLFSNQSLGFIFLINNFYFVRQQLEAIWTIDDHTHFLNRLTHKINRYIQSYLQVSWAPVLKCLSNSTIHCFNRNSPLQKFQSKFQKTYAARKLWKVPDTELRKRLREAILGIVVSDFLEYLEDNNSITPGVTPQEKEEMLQELFEG